MGRYLCLAGLLVPTHRFEAYGAPLQLGSMELVPETAEVQLLCGWQAAWAGHTGHDALCIPRSQRGFAECWYAFCQANGAAAPAPENWVGLCFGLDSLSKLQAHG